MPELRPVGADHLARCVKAEIVLGQEQGKVGDPIEMPGAARDEVPVLRLENLVASYGGPLGEPRPRAP